MYECMGCRWDCAHVCASNVSVIVCLGARKYLFRCALVHDHMCAYVLVCMCIAEYTLHQCVVMFMLASVPVCMHACMHICVFVCVCVLMRIRARV